MSGTAEYEVDFIPSDGRKPYRLGFASHEGAVAAIAASMASPSVQSAVLLPRRHPTPDRKGGQ